MFTHHCLLWTFLVLISSIKATTAFERSTFRPQTYHQQRIVASLSASTSNIHLIRTKPKHVDSVYTSLTKITLDQDKLYVDWTLVVIGKQPANNSNLGQRKRRQNIISVRAIRPLEWAVSVREFANETKRTYRIIDDMETLQNKSYSIEVKKMKTGKSYEICLISNDYPIKDNEPLHVAARNSCSQDGILCKEFTIESPNKTNQTALASVVTSASTFIVVVLFCCCFCSKDKSDDDRSDGKRGGYLKVANYFNQTKRSPSLAANRTSSSDDTNSSDINSTYRPVTSDDESKSSQGYYFNPRDIISVSTQNLRVFVKEPVRLYKPVELSDSIYDNEPSLEERKNSRPNSWPHSERSASSAEGISVHSSSS